MVRMTLLVCYLAFSLVRLVSGTGKGTGAPEEAAPPEEAEQPEEAEREALFLFR